MAVFYSENLRTWDSLLQCVQNFYTTGIIFQSIRVAVCIIRLLRKDFLTALQSITCTKYPFFF